MDLLSASGHSFEKLCLGLEIRAVMIHQARQYCRNRQLAREIEQDALIRALLAWPGWVPRADLDLRRACESWLLLITARVFFNQRARARLHGEREAEHVLEIFDRTHGGVIELRRASERHPGRPSVGMIKVERTEIVAWSLEEYARLLDAAKALDPMWYAACCLAGEAGLRVGEIRALDWRRDVDLMDGTITINQQMRGGQMMTPKGRTRRTVPMTDTLLAALKTLDVVRTGFVIRSLDGASMTDNETKYHWYRICRAADLPQRGWHKLRHAFGTHAAMLGVNPWKLMLWMGHKRIDETMRYVNFAQAHHRPLPEVIVQASRRHNDPDRRVITMLAARRLVPCR